MFRSFWIFGINESFMNHQKLICTLIDLEVLSSQTWHKLFEVGKYALYLRGSSDHKALTALNKNGRGLK